MVVGKIVRNGSFDIRRILILWGPVLLWMAVIFMLSAQSGLGGQQWPPWLQALRKTGHVAEYAALGVLLGRALLLTWCEKGSIERPSRSLLRQAWQLGVVLSTLYAISDEFHQSFVPQRGAHIEDVMIDALSATAALGIWFILLNRRLTMSDR